ncbi:MAG: hypothetical protein COS42_06340 [Flavobacteriales bacterium CG03_land_8_20_14_0_80_35_15]|nr:MAG: hypothetical protein AUJ53_01985 [Flavobacteriaceae bacterium CG1_02_35_72]PIV17142.1 MAG: hypothetical protein COS42_06340 [Flavobacteriales bacterium CG03_land_8_20_14_0_80_35_15]PIX07260.1 MAG: hypothetical protein COZ76_04475 [Flavobacteriales bacterium CG_4_8_14_3_um_filter_35_10]PJA04564.1 MAG: hypothetical protein COX71_10970 [Flavobacteriales bacterium CG_4_10_14_0_2_um_filter_35_18]
MNSPRVVTHGGVTLNLATIKCFKLKTNTELGKSGVMTVEHKSRFEYIQHPETGEYEKQEYNEKTEVDYSTYSSAEAHRNEWEEIWQDYLDDQG